MEDHVRRYYTPDNALIVLVGNIEPKGAIRAIDRYFGTIPRAKIPKEEVVTREPEPAGTTRFTMRGDAKPRFDMLFHIPGYPDDALYKLDIIEGIFSGRSGRLYRRLVDKEGLCTDAGAGSNIRLHNGDFHIWAELKNDTDPKRVEAIIKEELTLACAKRPTEKEILRISNEIRMAFISELKSLEGLSDRLAWFERLRSWKDLLAYPEKISSVKPDEIPQTAVRYLDPELATVGLLLPKKPAAEAPKKPAPPKKTR